MKDTPIWTEQEKILFKREFINHPKLWHKISPLIPGGKKSVSDCVKYYYLSKKKEKYKKAVRSARTKVGRRKLPRPEETAIVEEPSLASRHSPPQTRSGRQRNEKVPAWSDEEVNSLKVGVRYFWLALFELFKYGF